MSARLFGVPLVECDLLPIPPSPGEVARRIVRHAYAESGHMAWLGLEVGPAPDVETHALLVGNSVHASAAFIGRLRDEP